MSRPSRQSVQAPRHRFHYAWWVLATGTLVVFGSLGLARFSYTMLLPAMQDGLGLSHAQAGALATANLIGYLVLAVSGGALASRYGPRVVIAAGLTLAGLAMILTGMAQGFAGAAVWRALAGIGSGASNVPAMGLLAAWFAPRRRGLAAGIGVTGSSLALIGLGPGVPYLLALFGEPGWRICWFLFGGGTLLLALLAYAVLRDSPAILGLRPLGAPPEASEPSVPPAAAGRTGLRWGTVYRSPAVLVLGGVYVAFGFSYIVYITFFTQYLITVGGYTTAAAGRLYMLVGWCSLLCGLLWGMVSDVIGRKGAPFIVYTIHTVAFALFALWPSPAGFTLSAVLFGLTAWSIPAIVAAACGDILGSRLAPAGLGFVTLFFGVGQAAAPGVAGLLADAVQSLAPAMLLAAAIAALGALGSLLLRSAPLEAD